MRWMKQIEWFFIELYNDHWWSNWLRSKWQNLSGWTIPMVTSDWNIESLEDLDLLVIFFCQVFRSFESGNTDDVEVCFSCFQLRFLLGFCWLLFQTCWVLFQVHVFASVFLDVIWIIVTYFMLLWLVRCMVHIFSKWPESPCRGKDHHEWCQAQDDRKSAWQLRFFLEKLGCQNYHFLEEPQTCKNMVVWLFTIYIYNLWLQYIINCFSLVFRIAKSPS